MNYFNGKKTTIGAVGLLAAAAVRWVSGSETPDAAQILEAVAAVLASVGLVHKGVKRLR